MNELIAGVSYNSWSVLRVRLLQWSRRKQKCQAKLWLSLWRDV